MPHEEKDAEELREVLGTVSEMVPGLIKGIIASVFSAEAGKSMGAAVASFYKELKASGLPEDVALKMTQDYAKTFTDIGKVIQSAMSQKGHVEMKGDFKPKEHGEEEDEEA